LASQPRYREGGEAMQYNNSKNDNHNVTDCEEIITGTKTCKLLSSPAKCASLKQKL
jgi:geranylgeranyl pyrophosphate synthase